MRWCAFLGLLSLVACDPAGSSHPPEAKAATASASATTSAVAAPSSSVLTPAGNAKLDEARKLARRTLVVDGHVDLPYRLLEAKGDKPDVSQLTSDGDFDYVRAKRGGLDAPFMSIYIPAEYQQKGGAKALADQLIDMVEALVEKSPDKFALAKSPADVRAAFAAGKIAFPMGIENGAAIEGKLENLKHFYDRGVRYITLTHSKDNKICDSSYDEAHSHKGLSDFGREVVGEMNRLGIMVDIAHVSDDTFMQVLDLSQAPVIASHSSLRHFVPGFERDVSDEMLKALAAKGGVIMINFGSTFIDGPVHEAWNERRLAREKYMKDEGIEDREDPKVKAFEKDYDAEHDLPLSTVQRVADHIDRVKQLVGIDHVGLGSDFEGVGPTLPHGLRDVSQLPNLIAELLGRGYTPQEIEKVCSGNVLRVWQAVADHAAG